jgi:hypothetical protein
MTPLYQASARNSETSTPDGRVSVNEDAEGRVGVVAPVSVPADGVLVPGCEGRSGRGPPDRARAQGESGAAGPIAPASGNQTNNGASPQRPTTPTQARPVLPLRKLIKVRTASANVAPIRTKKIAPTKNSSSWASILRLSHDDSTPAPVDSRQSVGGREPPSRLRRTPPKAPHPPSGYSPQRSLRSLGGETAHFGFAV